MALELANGDRVEVAIGDLIDAGLLPEGFGDRDGAGVLGVTPIGQRYQVFSIKDGGGYDDPLVTDGIVRTVIVDLGTPNPGRMERVGIANLPERILAFKEAVSLYTTREERVAMGVVPAGGDEVRGVGRVFTKDIIDWIENAPAEGAAVALVGFPDLDPADTVGTNPNPTDEFADCQVIPDHFGCGFGGCSASFAPPTCPTGWEELARPRVCGAGGTNVSSTPVGVVVSGLQNETTSSGANTASLCSLSRQTVRFAVVSLNGADILRQNCTLTQLTSEWVVNPLGGADTCVTTTQGVDENPGVVGNPNAYGVLCCLPRPPTP